MERVPTPFNPKLARLRLVGVTELGLCGGAEGLVRAAEAALRGGLPALLMREKSLPDAKAEPLARELASRARGAGALFIVSRRVELARAVAADGVHLGAADGPSIESARKALGPGALIGYSAHTEAEAMDALARGADYVFFSPIFQTPSKAAFLPPVGLERLAALAARAPGRVFALGGIDATNIAHAAATGAAGAAAIRALFAAPDPAAAAADLLARWDEGELHAQTRAISDF